MDFYLVDSSVQIKHFKNLDIINQHKPSNNFDISFSKNEIYALQLACVCDCDTRILHISCCGNTDGKVICINTDGVNHNGQKFINSPLVPSNTIQPLFFIFNYTMANIETDIVFITVQTDNGEYKLTINVNLNNKPVENYGFNNIYGMSRLLWLNSKKAVDNTIVKPFIPITNNSLSFNILGRKIKFGDNALPERVESFFDESVSLCEKSQCELLSKPTAFEIYGETINYKITKIENLENLVEIESKGENDNCIVIINSKLYYDGLIKSSIKIVAKKSVAFSDINFSYKLTPYASRYMNGFSHEGGHLENMSAQFNSHFNWDCIFTGNVNIGIRTKFKAENYIRPLINIYYHNQELVVPTKTWDNNGKGRINVIQNDDGAFVSFNTNKYEMKKDEIRCFDLEMHITPFKSVDYKKQFNVRYFHNETERVKDEYEDINDAYEKGFTHIIYHHGTPVNPYINYPFVENERLKNAVNAANQKGISTKIYYTVREHSNHMAETFAYKALGNEIIIRKKGDGMTWVAGGVSPWLKEYFGERVIPAWRVKFDPETYKSDDDVTFLVHPDSRLDNYYIEGLDWLVKNIGIKGIYIDDSAIDRTTIERAKKVLSQCEGLIDMHTWNHHCDMAGNASCLNIYTELLPFIDSMWIGEDFNVNNYSPDYIMTEIACLPYGLGSQMLDSGGNLYIGMLYAMNSRYPWNNCEALEEYKLWDNFGIQNSQMYGYWHSKNPVTSSNVNVYITTYDKCDSTMICMYNFSDTPQKFSLNFADCKINDCLNIFSPVIQNRQSYKKYCCDDTITIAQHNGLILIAEKNDN